MNRNSLKKIPKMDQLLNKSEVIEALNKTKRVYVIEALREALDEVREAILGGKTDGFKEEDILDSFNRILELKKSDRLKRVINCTGVVIHTNLGRSILSKKAALKVSEIASSYNNLEYDIEAGRRGERYSHIEDIIKRLTGAEAALVVNNNAAAVMLVLSTLCSGKEAVVSRGQLVEIGGSFRIPEVMKLSGTILREVGTTNRTHMEDYIEAINENTAALLRIHTSNYKILGFTLEPSIEEIVEIGKENNIPVIEDIGSGTLLDMSKFGLPEEPTVIESIKKGIDIVTFSGDKLLGGPQAGIIAGKKDLIDKMKQNQLLRALRVDKMTLSALEATLSEYLDEQDAIDNIPTLKMLTVSYEDLNRKAINLKRRLSKINGLSIKLTDDFSTVGGGSMPLSKIKSRVLSISYDKMSADKLENELRKNNVPIIVRINEDKVIMDIRTVQDGDFTDIYNAFLNISRGE
ncbi:MAG: L-seryl-tRNA(Sec) selenium transferase [Bacillota bacterium]|nr:L-seryl-tRNA(Sec) selenium transferase [Bacillota bacterium]